MRTWDFSDDRAPKPHPALTAREYEQQRAYAEALARQHRLALAGWTVPLSWVDEAILKDLGIRADA